MGRGAGGFLSRWAEGGPPLNAVILTVGLLLVLEAVVPMIWGAQIRACPAPVSIAAMEWGGFSIALSPLNLFTIGVVALVVLGLFLLFRGTNLGLPMRAAAFAPEVSRL